MKSQYPEIGVCGLSCVLCPGYVMKTKSRCPGCKTSWRLGGPCSILHCAVKRNLEFCGECPEGKTCEKWKKHREMGKRYDSFKCYQKLEEDINFLQKHGLAEFRQAQKVRAKLLDQMLEEFNEGRSKSYFCLVATILEVDEIEKALKQARNKSKGLNIKEKAKLLHSIFDEIALKNHYCLKLRKKIKD
ncbi:DUF3795 domain-containing protein [Candidatus Shapirobacteria bacterium]|nr:DUF3795 domain-containing protein [Candidatus Shapirobacteria bacterium]